MTLSCYDDEVVITGVTWSSWGGATATGTGQLGENDCQSALQPCAQGRFMFEPASVALGSLTASALGATYRSVTVTPLAPNPGRFTAHSERLPG